MCNLAEMMLDAVVAMAISAFCFLGAPLKHDTIVRPHHVRAVVTVRRIPVSGSADMARATVTSRSKPRLTTSA